jgi:hypothetical protein
MTYGRVPPASGAQHPNGAPVSHSAELVRGKFASSEGPLIRPSGTFSPRGEGMSRPR